MSDKIQEITGQAVIEFSRDLFRTVAEKYGGDRTLNEIRIMNQVIVCHLKHRTCCVTALHQVTGIPIPTVSRAVANLLNYGWLCERRDPNDGRKRIVSLGPRSLERTPDDIDGQVEWIRNFRKHGLPD